MWKWIKLITNSCLVVPHNPIHKYKHALVDKDFKKYISFKKKLTHKHIYIYMKQKKGKTVQTERIEKHIEKKTKKA